MHAGGRELHRPAPGQRGGDGGRLLLPGDDQPDLVGGVDRREAEADPGRRRLRAVADGDDRALVVRGRRSGKIEAVWPSGPMPSSSTSNAAGRGPRRRRRPARRRTRRRRPPGRRTAPSDGGIGWTRSAGTPSASSRARRAPFSLRSSSSAGTNRSSPHQTSTAASRPSGRPAARAATAPGPRCRRRRRSARPTPPVHGLGVDQPGDQRRGDRRARTSASGRRRRPARGVRVTARRPWLRPPLPAGRRRRRLLRRVVPDVLPLGRSPASPLTPVAASSASA